MGQGLNRLVFQPPTPTYGNDTNLLWLQTSKREIIPAFHIFRSSSRHTILFSHGNAEDLGMIVNYFKEVAEAWDVNIFAYEYTGYGMSSGVPSEQNVYADIEAAYEYLTKKFKAPWHQIVLYGRSLGTGASVHLASTVPVRGMILQSGLLSIHRVGLNLRLTLPGDMFCNIDKISKVQCPVLVIHGVKDEIVPFSHGMQLYNACRTAVTPYWLEEAGHNNVELTGQTEFIENVARFLKFLEVTPLGAAAERLPKLELYKDRRKFLQCCIGTASSLKLPPLTSTSRSKIKPPSYTGVLDKPSRTAISPNGSNTAHCPTPRASRPPRCPNSRESPPVSQPHPRPSPKAKPLRMQSAHVPMRMEKRSPIGLFSEDRHLLPSSESRYRRGFAPGIVERRVSMIPDVLPTPRVRYNSQIFTAIVSSPDMRVSRQVRLNISPCPQSSKELSRYARSPLSARLSSSHPIPSITPLPSGTSPRFPLTTTSSMASARTARAADDLLLFPKTFRPKRFHVCCGGDNVSHFSHSDSERSSTRFKKRQRQLRPFPPSNQRVFSHRDKSVSCDKVTTSTQSSLREVDKSSPTEDCCHSITVMAKLSDSHRRKTRARDNSKALRPADSESQHKAIPSIKKMKRQTSSPLTSRSTSRARPSANRSQSTHRNVQMPRLSSRIEPPRGNRCGRPTTRHRKHSFIETVMLPSCIASASSQRRTTTNLVLSSSPYMSRAPSSEWGSNGTVTQFNGTSRAEKLSHQNRSRSVSQKVTSHMSSFLPQRNLHHSLDVIEESVASVRRHRPAKITERSQHRPMTSITTTGPHPRTEK